MLDKDGNLIGLEVEWECGVCGTTKKTTTPIQGKTISLNIPFKCECGALLKRFIPSRANIFKYTKEVH